MLKYDCVCSLFSRQGSSMAANDLKRGMLIEQLGGKLIEVQEAFHSAGQARQGGFIALECRDVHTGAKSRMKLAPSKTVEVRYLSSSASVNSIMYLVSFWVSVPLGGCPSVSPLLGAQRTTPFGMCVNPPSMMHYFASFCWMVMLLQANTYPPPPPPSGAIT